MPELRVRDLMTPKVVSVLPEDSVATGYELMLDHRIRHLVVIDKDGDLAAPTSGARTSASAPRR